jgi:hypothetical protein
MCDFCSEMDAWDSSTGKWFDEPNDFRPAHQTAMEIRRMVEADGVRLIFAMSLYFQMCYTWQSVTLRCILGEGGRSRL